MVVFDVAAGIAEGPKTVREKVDVVLLEGLIFEVPVRVLRQLALNLLALVLHEDLYFLSRFRLRSQFFGELELIDDIYLG